jgi:hypothetical protein
MPQQELRVIAKGQGEWVDVSAWGYDLRSSGNYRIVGMPAVGDPDAKFDVKALNSDEGKEGIAITIER